MANYYDGFDVRPFTLWLEVFTASQNIAANTSTVTGYLRIRKDGNSTPWNDDTSPYGISINGSNSNGNITYDMRSLGIGGTHWVGSFTVVVPHNADGTKTINVSANFNDSGGQLDFATLSGTYTLATIPRVSEPDITTPAAPTVVIGTRDAGLPIRVRFHRASASFTHTIKYSYGTATNVNVVTKTTVGDYDWTIPTSVLNNIPTATSGVMSINVETFSGTTSLGSRTVNLTVRVPDTDRPNFTFTSGNISEGNPAVTTAAIGQYVQNVSKITAAMAGWTPSTGATIVSQKITASGHTINGTSGTTPVITQSGTVPVEATVVDSRGYSVSKTVNITVLSYTLPQIISMSAQRSDAAGNALSNGEYVTIGLNATTKSLVVGTEKNNMTIKTFARLRGTTDWDLPRSTVVDPDRVFNGSYVVAGALFDDELAYDLRVEVTDKFNLAPGERAVSTAGITMHWDDGGGVGIGKFWSQGALDVEGSVYASDVRLASTGGASLSSTAHGFQIGASSSLNLIADQNEIQARSNGAASPLTLNGNGGAVVIGNSASNNSVPGNLIVDQSIYVESSIVGRQGTGHLLFLASDDAGTSMSDLQFLNDGTLRTRAGGAGGQYRPFPFATAAGRSTISATGTTTITFPANRFTQAPRVTAQVVESGGVVAVVWISTDPTTANFVARVYTLGGVQRAGTIEWQAVQMTPTAATG